MVFSGADMIFENISDEGPFIVPLAVPLVAGPSAMAMVILLMAREPSRWLDWLIALFLAWFASSVLFILSDKLSQLLSKRAFKAIERLIGMILTAVAIEMLVEGIRSSGFN